MSCFHPIEAYGKKSSDGSFSDVFFNKPSSILGFEKLKIPCGQCIGCRLEYSRQWMIRCSLEALDYPGKCFFITLTYDNEHLPFNFQGGVDSFTGEVLDLPVPTLRKRDLQLFMKRLRRRFEPDIIRFYGCGEYGSSNGRPHYHLSVFNLNLTDLKIRDKLVSGFNEFSSKTLEDIWKNGRVSVSPFSPATAGYVARYMLKKHKGKDKDFYVKNGLDPEFSVMSRKPGIGYRYFDLHKEHIYRFDHLFVNGVICRPPKYFDNLLRDVDTELITRLKEHRRYIVNSGLSPDTDLSDEDYLEVLEAYQSDRVKSLPRVL